MNCYCYDYEFEEYYKSIREAKKDIPCQECETWIQKGEKYERVSALFESKYYLYNTCSRCLELRDYVSAHVPCFCWTHESMIEVAIEVVEENDPELPGFLFGALRRVVKIKRHKKQYGATL